jgi:hypothetical protein
MVCGREPVGKVISQNSDKIVINSDGSLIVLFRDKVSFIKMHEDIDKENNNDTYNTEEYIDKSISRKMETKFPENGISYNETFLSIPKNLLNKSLSEDIDLSISFADKKNSNITFKVDNDS